MNPPELISIAAFVSHYSRGLRRAPRERLLPYLEWFWRDQRLGVLREHGKIVAVCLVRCLQNVEQASDPYHHEPDGPLVWVDDIICRHARAIGILLGMAQKQLGERQAFAGHVFTRDRELRMIPWKIVKRLAT